ncbi:MAG: glycosyltransferase family 4 protein [Candidatus Eisenbacteria bacterium]|nr:glycosyltransferase family 4 protein [Candidatus Eisenbacteria bacterium]MCC7143121.1 glycosyltransferase family 4 protein [Candidatus Eisenbacteria bacterium]
MKIAMVGQKGIPATYGGIERHVEEIGTRLVERGHEVDVYSRFHYSHQQGTYRGVRIRRLPSVNTKHLDTITHCALATVDSLFRSYDIIHYHALGPSVFARLARLWGPKTVVTVHGLDWERGKWGKLASWFLKACETPAIHFPNKTIVVSKTLREYFLEKYNVDTAFIPNGANPGVFRPPNKLKKYGLDKHRYVLYVGRLVPEKGCHYLLEAWSQLKTDTRLVMAGGSSFSDGYVDSLMRIRNGDERIHMVGYVYGDLLEEMWSNAYMVVQPSILEGLSISLIEAISHGKCVLASDIPENLEVIEDCAVTFRNRDVLDLRDKLSHLLAHPEQVDEVARRCRRHAEQHYSWAKITEATEAVYLDLLSGAGHDASQARPEGQPKLTVLESPRDAGSRARRDRG